MSTKSIIFGIFIASLFWGLGLFTLQFEYEIPRPPEWATELTIKENPVTQNRRVIDTEAKTTVFWTPGNPVVLPVEVTKDGPNRWHVIFEKLDIPSGTMLANAPEDVVRDSAAPKSRSDRHKVNLVEALKTLKNIPQNEDTANRENRRNSVRSVIERFDDPDDVETLASLCLALSRHCESPECPQKGDSELRNVFETAYWEIINKLAENKEKNMGVLNNIRYRSQLDGSNAGEWLRIVEGKTFP